MPTLRPETKVRYHKGWSGTIPRDGRNNEFNITFDVWDTVIDKEDPTYFDTLYEQLVLRAPTTYLGLERGNIDFEEDSEGSRNYKFNVKYASYVPTDSQIRWSWDTTGGTVKLSTSRATTAYAIAGRTAPNHQHSIGVKKDEVEGVDIVIPSLKLTATYRHLYTDGIVDNSTIDAYIKSLARQTGTTNNATWLTYAQGELLFLGSTGEFVPGKDTEVQYHFAASENVTGLSIGTIASVAKKGHDYLWVSFEPSEDASAIVRKPTFCYVERVYGESDFDDFGIN